MLNFHCDWNIVTFLGDVEIDIEGLIANKKRHVAVSYCFSEVSANTRITNKKSPCL
jgi:hypothetical protein